MLPRTVRGLARSGLLRTGLGQPQLVPVHRIHPFSRSTAIRQAQAPPSSSQSQYSAAFFSGGALALAVGLWWLHYGREPMAMERQATPAEGAATVVKQTPGAAPTAAPQSTPKSNTRHFTRAQVAEHTTKEKGVWVTFRGGVYDVTDFIAQHPGGDKLMLAAGSALEPFWKIYTIHDTDAVREILASYRIGELDPADAKAALAEAAEAARANPEDPFRTDPERSPLLVVRSAKPFNGMMLLLDDAFR